MQRVLVGISLFVKTCSTKRALPEAVQAAQMLWLEEMIGKHHGVAVAGSLAWHDYSAADPALLSHHPDFFAEKKKHYNMDVVYVNWPWSDQEFAARIGSALCECLQKLEGDPGIHSVLLVSHALLFDAQMFRRPQNVGWGLSNVYFGNLTLGQRVLETTSKMRAVVSGHTHMGMEGQARRTDCPETPPLPAFVLGSDYHAPIYRIIAKSILAGR